MLKRISTHSYVTEASSIRYEEEERMREGERNKEQVEERRGEERRGEERREEEMGLNGTEFSCTEGLLRPIRVM